MAANVDGVVSGGISPAEADVYLAVVLDDSLGAHVTVV